MPRSSRSPLFHDAGFVNDHETADDLLTRVMLQMTGEEADAAPLDPVVRAERAGMHLDAWQQKALRSDASRLMLLCSRQSGKSTVAALLALETALSKPDSLILLLSPTLRQSGELFRDKVLRSWRAMGSPLNRRAPTQLTLELANRSRIVSLPENESGIRGFSGVSLLVIDEAARVSDSLYYAVRPMLAVSHGRLVVLSTPFGKRGWFHEEWHGAGAWERFKVTADQCPRISPAFLEEERLSIGERWFKQEYFVEFTDMVGAVFAYADIQAALDDNVQPLFVLTGDTTSAPSAALTDGIEPLFG